MASLISGYNYDIFISYRQKDNKGDRWVSNFVEALKTELEATFKEDVSVYFDENPHDRLQETHNVDKSLEDKLKCLIFIPILSQTYCDPNSYAWQNEFLAFIKMTEDDRFGKDVKLRSGNVASRILPIRIHDLEPEDVRLFEKETGSVLRAMDFVFKTSSGVNRPLLSEDSRNDNLNKTLYRDQINKVAGAIKEIILGMKAEPPRVILEEDQPKESLKKEVRKDNIRIVPKQQFKGYKIRFLIPAAVVTLLIFAGIISYQKIFKSDNLERLRASGDRISIAVMPFQNMTSDSGTDNLQSLIQYNLINSLSNSGELETRPIEFIDNLINSQGLNYASLTPAIAGTISKKLDTDVFICGSVGQVGSAIRIYAQIYDSKTKVVYKSFQIDISSREELRNFDIIDSLSEMIKDFLVVSKLKKETSMNLQGMLSTCNSPEAYNYFIIGKKAFEKRDYPAVFDNLTKAIEIDSTFTYAPILLAQAYANVGVYDSAKKVVLKLYRKREMMSPEMRTYVDWIHSNIFETPDTRIKYLKQLLEIDDQSPDYHYLLGVAYININQFYDAIPECEKALTINYKWGSRPWWVGNYTGLGYCYHMTNMYHKEKKLYERAEKDFPDDPDLIFRQAVLALSERKAKAANNYIEKYRAILKEKSASEADIATNLADIYWQAELLDKAEEFYRMALSLESKSQGRMNILAYFLIYNDRNIPEGLELADTLLSYSPDNYNYLHTKGWGLYKQGKYQEASNTLQKSWDIRRGKAIYNHDAYLHLEAAKKAVAEQASTLN